MPDFHTAKRGQKGCLKDMLRFMKMAGFPPPPKGQIYRYKRLVTQSNLNSNPKILNQEKDRLKAAGKVKVINTKDKSILSFPRVVGAPKKSRARKVKRSKVELKPGMMIHFAGNARKRDGSFSAPAHWVMYLGKDKNGDHLCIDSIGNRVQDFNETISEYHGYFGTVDRIYDPFAPTKSRYKKRWSKNIY